MTHIGCGIWLFLLAVLLFVGGTSAVQRHGSIPAGVAAGLLAWFTLFSGYAGLLTIVSRFERHKHKEGIPTWGTALIWFIFIAAAICSFAVFKHLYAR
jgi:drug/metabolite transporter (DMT)-like permease